MMTRQDTERLTVIRECMENYGIGNDDAEWPNNIISRLAVAYDDGTIARAGDVVAHDIDESELVLCRGLAEAAAQVMGGTSVGMGSETDTPFEPFFVVSSAGLSPPHIDESLVRARFGQTLFPPANLTVEPLAEQGNWWGEVLLDGEKSEPEYFDPWRKMIAWFGQQTDFVNVAFVRIGDDRELNELSEAAYPPGTVMTGCVLPRLAIGLTAKGSISGLFGYVVQT